MPFTRIAAVSGLVFALLVTANAILLGDAPTPDSDLSAIREYAEGHQARHKAALLFIVLATGFAVVFFAGIVEFLRASDLVRHEAWGIAAFGGAILMGAAAIVGDTLFALFVYRGGSGLDDAMLGLLKDGELIAYSAMGISISTVAVSVAVPTFTRGVLPAWHGWVGVLVAILGLLGPVAMVADNDAGAWLHLCMAAGLGVWVLATSVVLLRRPAWTSPSGTAPN